MSESPRVPTKTVHWLVRRNDARQRIPVSGPFSSLDELHGQAYRYESAKWAQFEVQTIVYDQFGTAIITD